MRKYLAKRIFYALVVMWAVATLVFVILRAIPGDPISVMLGAEATPEAVAQLRANLGLDKPLPVQYLFWFRNLLVGDLGHSIITGQRVTILLLESIPRSFSIAIFGLLIGLVLAIPAGIISAVKKYTLADHTGTLLAFLGLSMPNFWLGIILILVFSVELGWFPALGYTPLSEGILPWLQHIFLPSLAIGTQFAAIIMRMTRSAMLEVLNEAYISTARAKGLREWVVILKHALRNALIPVITVIGIAFALLLSGTVVIEDVFAIKGLGRLLVRGIINRDFPVVQGAILVISMIFVFANLFVDILYTYINPKIRYEE
ncbi:MAG: ABC transporter permease [Nitrospinota bacterium]|nr:MAG: ABC transporter permease [Nitrospinota bacterium]